MHLKFSINIFPPKQIYLFPLSLKNSQGMKHTKLIEIKFQNSKPTADLYLTEIKGTLENRVIVLHKIETY